MKVLPSESRDCAQLKDQDEGLVRKCSDVAMSVGRGRRWMPGVSGRSQETAESLGIAHNCAQTTDRGAKAKEPGAHKSGIVEVHVVVGGDNCQPAVERGCASVPTWQCT